MQFGRRSTYSGKTPRILSKLDEEIEYTMELSAIHEHMKDTGFSVYSDAQFLYLIGKICLKGD